MNDKLKLRLLKVSKVGLKVGAGLMIGSGLAAYGMQFLPPEVYQEAINMLNSSKEALATYGVSSTLVGSGVIALQQGLKVVASSMNETELKLKVMETNLKKQVNAELQIHAKVDERAIDRLNTLIALEEKRIKQKNAIKGFNTITAKQNISMI